jgi:hypothetical protein
MDVGQLAGAPVRPPLDGQHHHVKRVRDGRHVWVARVTARLCSAITAIVFSIANALVLNVRIRAENAALGYA